MLCPESLVASITAAAVAIAKERKADEIGLLASVFSQLGDTLATIAVARDLCGDKAEAVAAGSMESKTGPNQ